MKLEHTANTDESKQLVISRQVGNLAVLLINNPPVNSLSRELRVALGAALAASEDDPAIERCLLIGGGKAFCAGGDIKEFDGEPPEPHLPDLTNQIEQSRLITIAAIHGACFGGGFELALSCDYRVAVAAARFAFPEVSLGLIPGAGGSQRLPRLIGMRAAAEMLSGGDVRTAQELLDLGGIDAIVAEPLEQSAIAFARSVDGKRAPISSRKLVKDNIDELYARYQRGAQAPRLNLDAVSWAADLPFAQGQARERALHLQLRQDLQAKALRHLFFAERAANKPPQLQALAARLIDSVAVFGGGLMGCGIAAAALLAGKSVRVFEQDEPSVLRAQESINSILAGAQARGKLRERLTTVQQRLALTADIEQVAEAQLVIEAVFEDLELKQSLFARLLPLVKGETILATNTSYLDPEAIVPSAAHERAAGLHFFSPAHVMKLVEVVALKNTTPQVLSDLFAFVLELRKQPVLAGIGPGFIGNKILAAYRREAEYLLADGASVGQIDRAMREFGFPLGPFELQDLAGLQIAWAQRRNAASSRPVDERYVDISDQLCERGRLGKRASAGWYDYLDGKKTDSAIVAQIISDYSAKHKIQRRAFSAEAIAKRLVAVMYNEANLIIEAGIANSAGDVDVVKAFGYSFPRWRGGPMFYGDNHLPAMHAAMQAVIQQSPNSWQLCQKLQAGKSC